MAGKKESDLPLDYATETGVYIDSSALAKLYVAEPESELLDHYRRDRLDLMISELTITEVVSAVARRRREGVLHPKQANRIRNAVLVDAGSGSFRRLDLSPAAPPRRTHSALYRIHSSTNSRCPAYRTRSFRRGETTGHFRSSHGGSGYLAWFGDRRTAFGFVQLIFGFNFFFWFSFRSFRSFRLWRKYTRQLTFTVLGNDY